MFLPVAVRIAATINTMITEIAIKVDVAANMVRTTDQILGFGGVAEIGVSDTGTVSPVTLETCAAVDVACSVFDEFEFSIEGESSSGETLCNGVADEENSGSEDGSLGDMF
jgi:hypothetical protein